MSEVETRGAEQRVTDVASELPSAEALDPHEKTLLEESIIDAMKLVYDPEIPVNIYDLGLIYAVDVQDSRHIDVKMTLTAPGCPVAQTFPKTVEDAVCSVDGVASATVELVWDPPWTQDRMSEAARYQLNMF